MRNTADLAARLRPLKDRGVKWETAWRFVTSGNRRDYFQPSDRDDGTCHPDEMLEDTETHMRFCYRVLRAAYLDIGHGCRLNLFEAA